MPTFQFLQHKKRSIWQSGVTIVFMFTFYSALQLVERYFTAAEHFLHSEWKQTQLAGCYFVEYQTL